MLGGVTAYSNDAKADLVGVNPELIETHGAVSPEVAGALADGAITRFGADVGVGLTGIAGPDGGTEENPVGYVCFCVVERGVGRLARDLQLPGARVDVRDRSTTVCLHLIRRRELGPSPSNHLLAPKPLGTRHSSGEHAEVAIVAERRGRISERSRCDPRECAADADPLRARLEHLGNREPGHGEHVHGLRERLADDADLLDGGQARRVEDVGTGAFVGLQARNRVVEIWVAPDVVLGARGEHKREAEGARGLDRRRDALDGV